MKNLILILLVIILSSCDCGQSSNTRIKPFVIVDIHPNAANCGREKYDIAKNNIYYTRYTYQDWTGSRYNICEKTGMYKLGDTIY